VFAFRKTNGAAKDEVIMSSQLIGSSERTLAITHTAGRSCGRAERRISTNAVALPDIAYGSRCAKFPFGSYTSRKAVCLRRSGKTARLAPWGGFLLDG
jgi:hypothetical protein